MKRLHRHPAETPKGNPESTPHGGAVAVRGRRGSAACRAGATFGLVGSGPSATEALKQLLKGSVPIKVTVFETDGEAGCGTTYRSGINADFMYCNAFSREIPPITQGFAHWRGSREGSFLTRWDLTRGDGATCVVRTPSGIGQYRFDRVLIATGHAWPENPKIGEVPLVSPRPYTNVTGLKPGRIGIPGSSLSAIDVVVALGHEHGDFVEDGARVVWTPKAGTEGLSISMVSQKGIMPEPDFYYSHPYEPLKHISRDAVAAVVAKAPEGLPGRVFDLLLAELEKADPDHLTDPGPGARTIGGFSDACFERRDRLEGLRALRDTLDEAVRSMGGKRTIPGRYAFLRGHESFDMAPPHLSDADWRIFSERLMPVFGDCYAAIPHVSFQRILALHDAGVLDIISTGAESTFADSNSGVSVTTIDGDVTFGALVDARGQAAAPLSDPPFPALVKMLKDPDKPVLEPFALNLPSGDSESVTRLAMPQALERQPFSQGLPNCAELAKTAMKAVAG
jgi:uncharacterized NAD(P)/FAD-binding protein YdhS